MTDSLRDFVYIDEESLNSNLSSLGRGVLEEITEETGSEKQTGGEGSIGAPNLGLGASGEHSRLTSENVTSTMRVLAPYRFNTLETLVESEEIPVFDGTEGSPPTRGKTVEITGEVKSMSLFKLETALRAFTDLLGGGTMETIDELDEEDVSEYPSSTGDGEEMTPEDVEVMEEVQAAVSQFTGSAIPIRMDVNGYPFAIPLDREFMRTPPEKEFLSDREYTVFGRVEENIRPGSEWDPLTLTRILDKYMPEDQFGPEFRRDMKGWAADMNIPMDRGDMLIDGPGSVVRPIAVHW